MTVEPGQTYRDLDPRMAGRTLRVVEIFGEQADQAKVEVVTNASDIQSLLDDETPGTRSYRPQDRRGKTSIISVARLAAGEDYGLIEDQPEISGPGV